MAYSLFFSGSNDALSMWGKIRSVSFVLFPKTRQPAQTLWSLNSKANSQLDVVVFSEVSYNVLNSELLDMFASYLSQREGFVAVLGAAAARVWVQLSNTHHIITRFESCETKLKWWWIYWVQSMTVSHKHRRNATWFSFIDSAFEWFSQHTVLFSELKFICHELRNKSRVSLFNVSFSFAFIAATKRAEHSARQL